MRVIRNAALVASLLLSQILFAEAGWQSLGDLVGAEEHGNQVVLNAQRGKVRVTAVAPDVVRVTYGPGGTLPPERSFAVLPDAFPAQTTFKVANGEAGLELHTDLLVVTVQKSPLRITFLDTSGKILSQERDDHPAAFHGTEFRECFPARHCAGQGYLGERPFSPRRTAFERRRFSTDSESCAG